MKTFADFRFPMPLTDALEAMGYEQPTPVQAQAIPLVLENRDVLATAQTGTGKTAAFALPLISKMLGGDKPADMRPVLIVAPTRELAEQIGAVLDQITTYCPQIKTAVVIGGIGYPQQIRALRANPMFVVGTPGRLLDQVRMGHLKLGTFGALVIDEADRLLDMGFEPQMNDLISKLPVERQSLLFSATLPEEIMTLANRFLRKPVRVSVGAVSKPVDKIKQDVIKVTASSKDQTLVQEIDKVAGSVLIFTKTKWKTEKLAKFLDGVGHEVGRIHGDRSQTQRSNAIRDFREGKIRILVATDIAARGLDIPHIEHVVNYDLPMAAEDYVHRIGRTARAGAEGHSIAFVTPEDTHLWAKIHKLMYGKFPDQGYNKPGSYQGRDQRGGRPQRRGGGGHERAGRPASGEFVSGAQSGWHKPPSRDERRAKAPEAPRGPRHSRYEAAGARHEERRFQSRSSRGPAAASEPRRQPSGNPRRAQEALANRFLEEERKTTAPQRPGARSSRKGGPNGPRSGESRSGGPRARSSGPSERQR